MKWKELYKIGITGSRKFRETDLVVQYLHRYILNDFENGIEDVCLILGYALGVDDAVRIACCSKGIPHLTIPARWIELEKSAGPRRNQFIVDMSQELIAFWDMKSPGTKDTIQRAEAKGIPVKILTVGKLRRELYVEPPVSVKIPRKVKQRDARKMTQLIRDAGYKEIDRKWNRR